MSSITLIGDIHGNKRKYLNIVNNTEYSIQVGDLDFDYEHLNQINPNNHIFIPGNHDNYDILLGKNAPKHALVGADITNFNGLEFFYVRGAWSIDYRYRKPGVDWWQDEELTFREMDRALNAYCMLKPDMVITHDAPSKAVAHIEDKSVFAKCGIREDFVSNTRQLLDAMYREHQPLLWIFGHWHKSFEKRVGRTVFRCLGIEECFNV